MKNVFFLGLILFLALLSCRNTDNDVQQINQILHVYIDSAKQDMLNAKLTGSYATVRMNDVYGQTDNAPVNFALKMTSDSLYYMEYVAGATRILVDSAASEKMYESKIALLITKKLNDSATVAVNDTLKLRYHSTPSYFRLTEAWYNEVPQSLTNDGAAHVLKISK